MGEPKHADRAGEQMESELASIARKLAALKRQLAEREPVVDREDRAPTSAPPAHK